jgi:hypothetical protein
MSQAGLIKIPTSVLPPSVPTSFVTNLGTAVPAANVLIVHGVQSNENNDNGIIAKGGVVGTGTSNEVDIVLTNRQTGTATTTDATPTTILTFILGAAPGVYSVDGSLVAFDVTDAAGASYSFTSGVRTTGAAAIEIGTEFKDLFEEVAMATADFTVSASGNTLIIQVIGIAGKTIDWNCYLNYRLVN